MLRLTASLSFLLLFSVCARADNITDLCNHDIEGTFLGTLNSKQVRINLICLTEDDLSATVCPSVDKDGNFGTDMVTNLSWAAVDQGRLIIANFALDNASRAFGSSKSMVSYLELNLSDLYSRHELVGTYISGGMAEFEAVAAKRIETYPKIVSTTKSVLQADAVAGTFRTDIPEERTNLVFNNLLGTPVVSLVGVESGIVIHFTEGPPWDSSGVFSSATAEGNGGEPDDIELNSIRGRFSDQDHLEFYLINPVRGLRGPYHGTRIPGSPTPIPPNDRSPTARPWQF